MPSGNCHWFGFGASALALDGQTDEKKGRTETRMSMWKKLAAICTSIALVVGLCPAFAYANAGGGVDNQTSLIAASSDLSTADIASLSEAGEQVRADIATLSPDPTQYSAADRDRVEAINAAFEALSAEDQATLDEASHPNDGQSYGRVLEAALWAVRSFNTDTSTTLANGTYYRATGTPAVDSASNKGKSDSTRERNWWVESVVVENGQATANIYVTSGAAGKSKLTSYPSVWIGGETIDRGADNTYAIPVDLNGTTYFGGISDSMPRPIMYALDTTIAEPVEVTFSAKDAKTDEAIANPTFTVKDAEGVAVAPVEGKYTLTPGAQYKVSISADGYRQVIDEAYTATADETAHTFSMHHTNYYYWMQIRGAKPVSEQTYSIHGTGEVVKLKAASASEAVVIPAPAEGEFYYVLDNLQVGETYTVSVDAPEGYALVTNGENGQGEWSVEQHGYVRETDGETHWEKTFTVTDDKEFLGNLIVNFVEYNPGADFTLVDAALAKVPASLNLFTAETKAPVKAAVAAVNRNEADQAKVDAMATAIEDALKGLVPNDGEYEVVITNANGTPNYIYDGAEQTDKNAIKGKLVVSGGKMTAELYVKGSKNTGPSYNYAFAGTSVAAAEAASTDASIAIEVVADLNNDNKPEGKVLFPVNALCTPIDYAYHSASKTSLTEGWYAQNLTFNAKGLKSLDPDEPIELGIWNEQDMFKAVSASLVTEADGSRTLVFALSGTGYIALYKGTYPEAVQDKDAIVAAIEAQESTDKTIYYQENADGKYEFRIPLDDDQTYIPLISVSARGFKNRATTPIETSGFYARQATLVDNETKLNLEDYKATADFAVTSTVADFKVAETASVSIVGGPVNNNYSVAATLAMLDETYDAVTYPSVVSGAVATATSQLEDSKFTIKMENAPSKQAFQDKTPLAFTFHVAENAPYEEAGTDVARTVTFDQVGRTIAIAGEPLTAKPASDPDDQKKDDQPSGDDQQGGDKPSGGDKQGDQPSGGDQQGDKPSGGDQKKGGDSDKPAAKTADEQVAASTGTAAKAASEGGMTDLDAKAWYMGGDGSNGGYFPGTKTLYLDYTLAKGLMSGYKDASGKVTGFGPEDQMNRAQAAVIVYRMANPNSTDTYSDAAAKNVKNTTGMTDVEDGRYYTAAVNWAVKNGVITGYTDKNGKPLGLFGPNDPISREQLATIIGRYMDPEGKAGKDVSNFKDADSISNWAHGGVAYCNANGIMTGIGDSGMFDPQTIATRCQMAKIIAVTDYLGQKK